MAMDFSLTPDQARLAKDARDFARDVLSRVRDATAGLPTPEARFAATRPFYEQAIAAGFLQRLIPAPCGGGGNGLVDMAVVAEVFYAADINVSLTLFANLLGLMPLFLAAHAIELAIRMIAGGLFPGWSVLLAPVLESLLWPVASVLLLIPQRRAPNPDENRPL